MCARWKVREGKKVDYYPIYEPNGYNHIQDGLTSIIED